MKKENFEEQLRRTFETHESSISPQTWGSIENQLGTISTHKKLKFSSGVIITLAAAIGFSAMLIWQNSSVKENSINELKTENGNSHYESASSQTSENGASLSNGESPSGSPLLESTSPLMDGGNQTILIDDHNRFSSNSNRRMGRDNPSEMNATQSNISFEIVPSQNKFSSDLQPASIQESTSILSNVRQTCAGTEVSFKPQHSPNDGSFLWNFGDGAFSNEPSPKHRFLKPGTYEVSLSVTDNKNAQINTVNMSETITILPNPDADFDWKFINSAKEAPMVEIKNLTTHATSAKWIFEDGSESSDMNPIKTFNTKGRHAVSVTAVNEYGCKDNRVKYININSDYNLNAPGSIVQGENFLPEGLKNLKGEFSLSIYDGARKIFESNNEHHPWSGKDQNGTLLEANKQYPWIAIIHDSKTGEDRYYSGAVLVKP